jgi:hypothetical protein
MTSEPDGPFACARDTHASGPAVAARLGPVCAAVMLLLSPSL